MPPPCRGHGAEVIGYFFQKNGFVRRDVIGAFVSHSFPPVGLVGWNRQCAAAVFWMSRGSNGDRGAFVQRGYPDILVRLCRHQMLFSGKEYGHRLLQVHTEVHLTPDPCTAYTATFKYCYPFAVAGFDTGACQVHRKGVSFDRVSGKIVPLHIHVTYHRRVVLPLVVDVIGCQQREVFVLHLAGGKVV